MGRGSNSACPCWLVMLQEVPKQRVRDFWARGIRDLVRGIPVHGQTELWPTQGILSGVTGQGAGCSAQQAQALEWYFLVWDPSWDDL